jgi:hypothetical protein
MGCEADVTEFSIVACAGRPILRAIIRFRVFAGVQLARGPSLELDYHVMPQALGVNPSGLGVELGFHL